MPPSDRAEHRPQHRLRRRGRRAACRHPAPVPGTAWNSQPAPVAEREHAGEAARRRALALQAPRSAVSPDRRKLCLRVIIDNAVGDRKHIGLPTATLAGSGIATRSLSPAASKCADCRERPRQRPAPCIELRAVGRAAADRQIERQARPARGRRPCRCRRASARRRGSGRCRARPPAPSAARARHNPARRHSSSGPRPSAGSAPGNAAARRE